MTNTPNKIHSKLQQWCTYSIRTILALNHNLRMRHNKTLWTFQMLTYNYVYNDCSFSLHKTTCNCCYICVFKQRNSHKLLVIFRLNTKTQWLNKHAHEDNWIDSHKDNLIYSIRSMELFYFLFNEKLLCRVDLAYFSTMDSDPDCSHVCLILYEKARRR